MKVFANKQAILEAANSLESFSHGIMFASSSDKQIQTTCILLVLWHELVTRTSSCSWVLESGFHISVYQHLRIIKLRV